MNNIVDSAMRRIAALAALAALVLWPAARLCADDVAALEKRAIAAAVERVAPAVVQIRTVGGLEQVERKVLAAGPTTGLIITADGYIVSSAFNFLQRPTSILVRLPGGDNVAAEIVGRDKSRMLVLLKVEPKSPLPTVEASPFAEMRPGQTAVALGRTFDAEQVNMSVGVIGALNRMHGRAIQTDANVSAASYGGPLVDLHGRVLGVLVPMAPNTGVGQASEMAGAEFYDSGIGFAIPLEHVLAILDRWKQQEQLDRGLLGIGLAKGNPHAEPAKISSVWPNSPAAAAGWKAGDQIVEVDGKPVATQTQLRFEVMPRYASDRLQVTLLRNEQRVETEITLAAELPKYAHPFLGILPIRDASDEGVAVRAVWPDSGATAAGLAVGDRLRGIDDAEIDGADEALDEMKQRHPGDQIQLTVLRDGEELSLTAELGELPTAILSADDLPAAGAGPASANQQAGAATIDPLKLPEFPQEAFVYEPPSPGGPLALMYWLGDGGEEAARATAARWQTVCDRRGILLLMPSPSDDEPWGADDLQYLTRLATFAAEQYEIDSRRVVVAGVGKAGQAAYLFGMSRRSGATGILAVDAPLPRTLEPPDTSPGRRLAFLVTAAENSPFSVLIRRDLQSLVEAGHPVTFLPRRTPGEAGQLSNAVRAQAGRWIDALDRF